MSLGIIFKGPEGIVLAADSRVTLNAQLKDAKDKNAPVMLLPAYYDSATKLLKVNGQEYVGAVTFGLGAIGTNSPRTVHSYIPEFEAGLKDKGRLSVEDFARALSEFFMTQYTSSMPKDLQVEPMCFFVAGFDENAIYGRVFEFFIPTNPNPKEWHAGAGQFGPVWGGQRQFVDRLLNGYDPQLLETMKEEFQPTPDDLDDFQKILDQQGLPIPYAFLPLQDCVDLAIF